MATAVRNVLSKKQEALKNAVSLLFLDNQSACMTVICNAWINCNYD